MIGCFETVGTAIAEAEANLRTTKQRHLHKVAKTWVDLHSMSSRKIDRASGMQKICLAHAKDSGVGPMPLSDGTGNKETTRPYISAPWDARMRTASIATDVVQAAVQGQQLPGVRIATSASTRNQLVGIGGVLDGVSWTNSEGNRREYVSTIAL